MMPGPPDAIKATLRSRLGQIDPDEPDPGTKPGWVAYMDGPGRDAASEYFVLACVVGRTATMDRLDAEAKGLKRGLVPESDPGAWELHGKEIWHGPDRKRRRTPLWPRTRAKKIAILGATVDTICDHDVTIFAVVAKKDYLRRTHGNDSKIVGYATTFLLEYLERFLRVHDRKEKVRAVSDSVRAGDRHETEKALADLIRGNNAQSHVKARRISGIELTDSLSSNNTQAADITAYVISRHMRGENALKPAFRRIEAKVWNGGAKRGIWVFEAGTAGRPYNRGRRP